MTRQRAAFQQFELRSPDRIRSPCGALDPEWLEFRLWPPDALRMARSVLRGLRRGLLPGRALEFACGAIAACILNSFFRLCAWAVFRGWHIYHIVI